MTNAPPPGTNAGRAVIDRLARLSPLAVGAAWLTIQAVVNSASTANDLARRGVAFGPAEPWIWECSSAVGALVWFLLLLEFDRRLRGHVPSLWGRIAGYALASVVFSVGHVLTMVALRQLTYRLVGWHYDFGPWSDGLLYEYRKDVLTFVAFLALVTAWRQLSTRTVADASPAPVATTTSASASPATSAAPTFMVRTATRGDLLVRAEEVDWIEAQGNYVALHVGAESLLLRHTLTEMETRLQSHGFMRTHRRALVNRQRMQAIIPPEQGELGVRLIDGQIVPLSEGRRADVLRGVLG